MSVESCTSLVICVDVWDVWDVSLKAQKNSRHILCVLQSMNFDFSIRLNSQAILSLSTVSSGIH